MKDYYKILEIEENATDDDIKKSYRALSKKYHPDVNPEGEEKFKEIAEAYEVLGNKAKREQYINSKRNPFNGGGSFEDIINQISIAKTKELLKNARKEILVIYEDDEVMMFKPLTFESSLKYGSGTKWCTAMKSEPEYFYRYSRNGILIYRSIRPVKLIKLTKHLLVNNLFIKVSTYL